MKIRGDLDGVVYVHAAGGGLVVLSAGDTVPDGVQVGEHLVEDGPKSESKDYDGAGVKRGRRSAPRPDPDA